MWDVSGTIEFVNDDFNELTGYESEELSGLTISKIGNTKISAEQYDEIHKVI
ncbi:PAS domain S-box protein [Planococcus kocurii]|uniref:PAS domain S-box protein n=1 Tax=Planococcus TaxID=1372 RepID=UPI001F1B7C39|nr:MULTISPECIES: PAS domain S-box protein [Planococcus]